MAAHVVFSTVKRPIDIFPFDCVADNLSIRLFRLQIVYVPEHRFFVGAPAQECCDVVVIVPLGDAQKVLLLESATPKQPVCAWMGSAHLIERLAAQVAESFRVGFAKLRDLPLVLGVITTITVLDLLWGEGAKKGLGVVWIEGHWRI